MDTLPPIPTPPAQRWREFRIQILPLIVFVIVVAMVALLWRGFVQPVGVIGEVEAVKANVTSLQDGLITDLNVDLLQPVQAGDVIGHVQVSSTDNVRAELATLVAELKITGARAATDERRRLQDLAALKLNLGEQLTVLAADLAQLTQASNNFDRISIVYRTNNGVYSADEYDFAEANFKKFDALVRYRSAIITTTSNILHTIESDGIVDVNSLIDSATKSHEQELGAIYAPVALKAPIDGVVSSIFRRQGERVLGREPLLTISARRGTRIIGYMRQPVAIFPTTNDTVIITTRGHPRRKGEGQIINVGTQFDLVRPGLFSTDSNLVDTGLPILISLPPGLEVIPGELVDLSIRFARN